MSRLKRKIIKNEAQKMNDQHGKIGIVGEGTRVKGDIKTMDNFRVEGFIEGNVITKSKLFLSETGQIDGDASAEVAEICGRFSGTLSVSGRLILRAGCVVTGNIRAEEFIIDEGAEFNGNVTTTPDSINNTNEEMPLSVAV